MIGADAPTPGEASGSPTSGSAGPAPSGQQWEITYREQRAVIVQIGGGIRSYSAGGRDVLDGYAADEMCSAGRGQVLIPWPNRVKDGRYRFDGRHHQLALTEPEHSNAIHGLVRWAPWTGSHIETDRVVVAHALHPQPGYPYFLQLSIGYRLSADGLRVRTAARNFGSTSCPFGSGAPPT
ncbi:MAG TPA: hypothetical protein VIM19_04835 [Actinomycetes bacterium]